MLFSQKRTAAAWLLLTCAVLLLQLLSQAAAAAGPPLELSKWNRAYKLTVSNIDSKLEDQYNLIEQTCVKGTGFESNAAAAPLDACRYRQEKNGTYTKWIKKAGEWRMNTNCYCYALNVYRDGFCIPGRSSRAVTDALMSGQEKTCKLMTAAVLADGAKPVTRAQALSAAQPPAGSHYIGLLVRKRSCMPMHCWQNDFHLVRKDDNGKWSWKEPGGPASALDINSNTVSDPEAAATAGLLPGHYKIWCGFFLVNPSTMKIGGNFDQPYNLQGQAAFLKRLPGLAVQLQEVPYNHSVDGAPDRLTQELIDQDAAWDAKRGTKEWNDFYAQLNASQSGGFDEHFAVQRQGMFNQQQQQPPPGLSPNNSTGVTDDRPDPEYEEDDAAAEEEQISGASNSSNNSNRSTAPQGPSETPRDMLSDESSVRNASSTAAAAAASTQHTPPTVMPVAMRAGTSAAVSSASNGVAAAGAVPPAAARTPPVQVQPSKAKPLAQPVSATVPATPTKAIIPASTATTGSTAAKPASVRHVRASPAAAARPHAVAPASSSRAHPKPTTASGPVQGTLDSNPNRSAGGRNGRRLLRSFA